MTDNTCSILANYLQYQRDIGIDDIIFEHGSIIKNILSGSGAAVNDAASGAAVGKHSLHTQNIPPQSQQSARAASGYDTSAFAKLSKTRPADTLTTRRLERNAITPLHSIVRSAKREKLAELYRDTVKCDKCALSADRIKVVFGAGSADGKLFVINGAPSQQDEEAGLPFQGGIGELFGRLLDRMGLDKKEDVFATYLQKCRNIHYMDADAAYANICKSILDKQIEIIEPRALLIFGQPTANFLLENSHGIEQLRSASHEYNSIPTIITYDLPLMLEETRYRHGAWEDMKKVLDMV